MGRNSFDTVIIGRGPQPEPVVEEIQVLKLPESRKLGIDPRRGVSKPFPPRKDLSIGRVRKPRTPKLLAGKVDPHETVAEILACNDYLRMGPARNIAGLHRIYQKDPTYGRSRASLYHYSWDYNWSLRADEYDNKLEATKNQVADEVLATGLAVSYTRIKKLKRLAQLLEEELARPGRLYITDTKQIGTGRYAREVSSVRFNSQLVEQYRAVMDDIAKETGGRVKPSASSDLPVNINVNIKDGSINNEPMSHEWLLEEEPSRPMGYGQATVKVDLMELLNAESKTIT